MIVRVIEIPVRYNGKTYGVNDEIQIKKEHHNPLLFEVIEEEMEFIENDKIDDETDYSKLTKGEIIAKLIELEVEHNKSDKKEDLLKLLEETTK